MDIILSFNNHEEVLELPVLPADFEIITGLYNSTFEVVSLGEIGVVGNRKLNTVSISSFFPKHYCSYCQRRDIPEPYEAVRKIEKWRDSQRPIRLTITEPFFTMACMIEEFKYREKGGQPGDVYYDLSLKEYRFIEMRSIKEVASGEGTKLEVDNKRPAERQIPNSYTVKQGDCLFLIAKRFYGDGNKWKEIYEKNKSVIGKDPNLIRPGQVLKL